MTPERVKIQFTDCLNRIARIANKKGLRAAARELNNLKSSLRAWCDDYQVNAEYYFDEIETITAISKNILVKKIDAAVLKINGYDIK